MTGIIFLILRILISIGLYAFLLFIFQYLWNENKQQGTKLSKRKVPSINLDISYYTEPVNRSFFDTSEISIGRGISCSCQLEDENVSSTHARLIYHHNQWWLEDLASTNGTFINDHKVTTPIVVISGDVIKCGNHSLRIEISGENLHNSQENKIKDDFGDRNG